MLYEKWIKLLFVVAGLYDGVLGFALAFFPGQIYDVYGVEPPNHMAYVQFPALLLIVFASMFFRIATDPLKHRELIIYGCGLKISYFAIAFWYWWTSGIPSMWIPWAWFDLVFLLLFILAWKYLASRALRD